MELILALFGALFATWYIGAGVVFVGLWLVIGTAYDRSDNTSAAMWMAVVAGLIIVPVIMGISPALDMFFSSAFWKNIALYLAAGLVYSWLVEFFFSVRRSSRFYADKWAETVKSDKKLKAYLADPWNSDSEVTRSAKESMEKFVSYYRNNGKVITVAMSDDGTITPRTNRRELVNSITAWTILWPAYAISLIVGDLFKQVVEVIVDVTSKLSNGFVRWAFRDTFKV